MFYKLTAYTGEKDDENELIPMELYSEFCEDLEAMKTILDETKKYISVTVEQEPGFAMVPNFYKRPQVIQRIEKYEGRIHARNRKFHKIRRTL